MSGHSKWSKIKRQKQAEDVKRGKVFSKLSRAISVAAIKGSDTDLKRAVDEAKKFNMPQDTIERAISKASGEGSEALEELLIEGYGPQGVAFYITAVTDNKNRTLAQIRRIFSNYGGSLGEKGSTAYLFKDKENPLFTVPIQEKDKAEKVLGLANALDEQEDVQEVHANFEIEDDWITELTA